MVDCAAWAGVRAKIEIPVINKTCRVRCNRDADFISDSPIRKYFVANSGDTCRVDRFLQITQSETS